MSVAIQRSVDMRANARIEFIYVFQIICLCHVHLVEHGDKSCRHCVEIVVPIPQQLQHRGACYWLDHRRNETDT